MSNKLTVDQIAEVVEGEIEGAYYTLARPEAWNGALLIHAHGFRPEGTPLQDLRAIDDPFWLRLIQQGWGVAVTSYRRAGLVVEDALRDLNLLRCAFANRWLQYPHEVFLDGRSMGGAVAVRLAERPNARTHWSGVLAVGAALLVEADLQLTHRPTVPILFLTNQSETGPIEHYIARVKENATTQSKQRSDIVAADEIMVPALHFVSRGGHNWTNAMERWGAFCTLTQWVFVGSLITAKTSVQNAPGTAVPGSCQFNANMTQLTTEIINAVSMETKANLQLRACFQDLEKIGIRLFNTFRVTINGHQLEVVLGAYPFVGIDDASIVASEDPEGFINLFEMANFRNQPAVVLPQIAVSNGEEVKVAVIPKERRKLSPALLNLFTARE